MMAREKRGEERGVKRRGSGRLQLVRGYAGKGLKGKSERGNIKVWDEGKMFK